MVSYLHRIDPFNYVDPGSLIDKYSDWILFTILLIFFISVVKLALRKRFEESRSFRMLVGSLGTLLAFSMYYSIYKGWLHLNLLGLGLFGSFLLILMVALTIYGFLRSYGTRKSISLGIGFILCYVTAWYLFPNHSEYISDLFPPLNGLLLVGFVFSVYKVSTSYFQPIGSLMNTDREFKSSAFKTADDVEVKREISEDKKEIKDIKRKTMKITKVEIKTLEEIEHHLKNLITLISKKRNTVDQRDIAHATNIVRAITKREDIFKKGLALMRDHINAYEALHKKDLTELQQRLNETKDKKKRHSIKIEMAYQNKMLEILKFMTIHENNIREFTQTFNRLMFTALERMKCPYPHESLPYFKKAQEDLQVMNNIFEKQKDYEKYLLTLNKKTIRGLKREKKNS